MGYYLGKLFHFRYIISLYANKQNIFCPVTNCDNWNELCLLYKVNGQKLWMRSQKRNDRILNIYFKVVIF